MSKKKKPIKFYDMPEGPVTDKKSKLSFTDRVKNFIAGAEHKVKSGKEEVNKDFQKVADKAYRDYQNGKISKIRLNATLAGLAATSGGIDYAAPEDAKDVALMAAPFVGGKLLEKGGKAIKSMRKGRKAEKAAEEAFQAGLKKGRAKDIRRTEEEWMNVGEENLKRNKAQRAKDRTPEYGKKVGQNKDTLRSRAKLNKEAAENDKILAKEAEAKRAAEKKTDERVRNYEDKYRKAQLDAEYKAKKLEETRKRNRAQGKLSKQDQKKIDKILETDPDIPKGY